MRWGGEAKALDGQQYPIPLGKWTLARRGERGDGPEEAHGPLIRVIRLECKPRKLG